MIRLSQERLVDPFGARPDAIAQNRADFREVAQSLSPQIAP